MGRPGLLLTLLLSLPLATVSAPAQPLPQDAATRLLLHLDGSLEGAAGEQPASSAGVAFTSGVLGGGAHVSGGVAYPLQGNAEPAEGTIELWVSPDWKGSDPTPAHTLAQLGEADSGRIWFGIDDHQNLRLTVTGAGASGTIAADVSGWTAGTWYHVAATWSRGALALFVNGRLLATPPPRERVTLPAFEGSLLWIGGAPGGATPAQATLDELRVSARARSETEVAQDYAAGLAITGLSLQIDPALPGGTLYESWRTSPRLRASTANLGARLLPPLLASWSSSDAAVAPVDGRGVVTALRTGNATIAATFLGLTASAPLGVRAAARPLSHDRFDSFLASPAAGALYEVPVVIVRLLPTQDGENIDTAETGGPAIRVEDRKLALDENAVYTKFMLEEGSRFRAYKDAAALPSIGYRVLDVISIHEPAPPGFRMSSGVYDAMRAALERGGADAVRTRRQPDDDGSGRQPLAGSEVYYPDYRQLLDRIGAREWVETRGVKEFWLYTYQTERVVPDESNMSSPTTGDISNSFRFEDDLPLFDRTYVLYGYNQLRNPTDNVHDHGHQLEFTLSYADERQHGDDDLFWRAFVGRDADRNWVPGRCGDVHHPPNARVDYDFNNTETVLSDIQDWTPFGGSRAPVNRDTWATFAHAWPLRSPPWLSAEPQWFVFWMQSLPGRGNTIPSPMGRLQNWWVFKADWDAAIGSGLGLEAPACAYTLGAASTAAGSLGGALTAALQTAPGCPWTATSNATWIRVDPGTRGGNGAGAVRLTVAPNLLVIPRSATVVVGGEVLAVTQEGARGDADGDGRIDVLDVFFLINYLFAHGPPPSARADANGDGTVDVLDVFLLINVLFARPA